MLTTILIYLAIVFILAPLTSAVILVPLAYFFEKIGISVSIRMLFGGIVRAFLFLVVSIYTLNFLNEEVNLLSIIIIFAAITLPSIRDYNRSKLAANHIQKIENPNYSKSVDESFFRPDRNMFIGEIIGLVLGYMLLF